MSEQPPIYVDKTPFFGRVEEQKQFIAALQATANRTAAARRLDDWFIQFRDIAKIALRDHPEWLPLLKIR